MNNRTNIFIDIETAKDDLVNEKLITKLREKAVADIVADKRLKDVEKQFADILEKRDKALKKLDDEASLSSMLGKIVSISCKIDDGDIFVSCNKLEKNVLNKFKEFLDCNLNENSNPRIITFNGKEFDIHFLLMRCMKNNVKLPIDLTKFLSKYSNEFHLDLRQLFTNFDKFGAGKLFEWALLFGIDCDDEFSGKDVQRLYDDENFGAIALHNIADVKLLHLIYEQIKDFVI